jgi:hypothetical protein
MFLMIREFDNEVLLAGIPDKSEWRTTTSHKFKTDLIEFFSDEKYGDETALEIGTHMGHTTYVLSHLFNNVITINKNPIDENYFCVGIDNIQYLVMNSYRPQGWPHWDWRKVSVCLIDAGHVYDAVKLDIQNALKLPKKNKFLIFDDFGKENNGVNQAVEEMVWLGHMDIVAYIGHEKGDVIKTDGQKDLVFTDYEGVICQTK